MATTTKMTVIGEGGGDRDDRDGGKVMGGRNIRGRMKGGAWTMATLSDVDIDVMGPHGKNKCARGNGPA